MHEEQALKAFLQAKNPPKMIFLFREPSKQMYSHYKMEKYRTKRVDMPLSEYIKLPKIDMYVDYASYVKKWVDAMRRPCTSGLLRFYVAQGRGDAGNSRIFGC